MAAIKTFMLLSLVHVAGCSSMSADKGGISSGGDHPPQGSTDSGTATNDAATSPATTASQPTPQSGTGATTAATDSGSGTTTGVSIAAEIIATAPASSPILAGGVASGTSSGAAPTSYLVCEAVIAANKTCKVSNYGVTFGAATAATASLFTADLPDLASVITSVTTNNNASGAYITNTSAAWCAVQTSSGSFYQVNGLVSTSSSPVWMTQLVSFLQLNCLSNKP